MNAIQKLRQLQQDITASGDGLKIVDAWALAGRLLLRMPINVDEAHRVLSEQDAAGLGALLDQLENPNAAPKETLPEFSHDEKAAAMKAFRKRLKLMRLSDESRLGGRYTSGGRTSSIDAIEPPDSHPPEIWKVLARDGELKDTGKGFFALANEPKKDPYA
ncbi:MAG: hypothetical protein AAGG07_06445 [Planctomycetota bacterium]